MEGFIVISAIVLSSLIWFSVQRCLVRAYGKALGLFWALAFQMVATGIIFTMGEAFINEFFPAKPMSWPAVGHGFVYLVDIIIYCVSTLCLNAVSAAGLAVLGGRDEGHGH